MQVLRLLRHLRLLHCLACAMKLCWDVRNYPLMLSLKPGIKSRLNFTKISSRTFNSKYAGQIYLQTHPRTHSKLCPDLCRHPGPWLVRLQILTLGEVLVLTIFLLALDLLYDYSYVFEAYAIRLREYNLPYNRSHATFKAECDILDTYMFMSFGYVLVDTIVIINEGLQFALPIVILPLLNVLRQQRLESNI